MAGGVDEVATEAAKARERAVLVSTGEPAVADHVGHQDCCEFPGLGHWTTPLDDEMYHDLLPQAA